MLKPRLSRLDWTFTDTPLYFLTACTWQRRRLLASSQAHGCFTAFAQQAQTHGVSVGRYVLMPDHLHLFAAFAPGAPRLSRWIAALKGALSAVWRAQGERAPFWQKGFFDHVMRSRESYAGKWLYVRENPVRAGLVKSWEAWPYQGEVHSLEL